MIANIFPLKRIQGIQSQREEKKIIFLLALSLLLAPRRLSFPALCFWFSRKVSPFFCPHPNPASSCKLGSELSVPFQKKFRCLSQMHHDKHHIFLLLSLIALVSGLIIKIAAFVIYTCALCVRESLGPSLNGDRYLHPA